MPASLPLLLPGGGRGWPISCLILDEVAFFLSESDGFQTGERVWAALAPSTAQFGPEGRIILASTPWGTSGLFAEMYQRAAAGEIADANAEHATTLQVNPTITAEFLEVEAQRDLDSFRAEYEAEFLGSGDAFIDFDRIDLNGGPPARPEDGVSWIAGIDPAFARDPFGLALVGRATDGAGFVIGPVRGLKAEGEFGAIVDEIASVAKEYRAKVITDQYSSAAVVERLRHEHGLRVEVNNMTATSKTAIFQELRARLYDGSLSLPDHPMLINELRRLRTKYSAGSAAILNPRVGGSHGDMAQALAIAVYEASTKIVSVSLPTFNTKLSRYAGFGSAGGGRYER